MVLEKTPEISLDSKEINQINLKEINPEYSLEGLMLKLKFQYFGHLMWRANPLEKTLVLEKIEDRRRRGWQRMRWLDSIIDYDYSLNMNLSKLWETVKDREAWHVAVHGVAKSRTWLSDWTTTAETIILSEVSQTEKDRWRMISPVCVIWKVAQMNLSTQQKQTHRHREQTHGC